MLLKSLVVFLSVIFLFSCKKESNDGGIRFLLFDRNEILIYSSMSASISKEYNGEIVKMKETTNIDETIEIKGINPGKYYWRYIVFYHTPDNASGSFSYNGEVVVEKGKIMNVAVTN